MYVCLCCFYILLSNGKNVSSPKLKHEFSDFEIGMQIKSFRAERGWSQGQVISKLGISQSTLSKIENGQLRPSSNLARKIEKVFGKSIGVIKEEERFSEYGRKRIEGFLKRSKDRKDK